MVLNTISLGYHELKNFLQEANRRRRLFQFRDRDWINKKLLEACLSFAKNGQRIVNKMVISRLHVALSELGIVKRRFNILLDGEINALEMQMQYKAHGVFTWAPRVKKWLETESYKFWLGIPQNPLTHEYLPSVDMVGRHSGGQ